jgi:dTDP-glucose 4,6-dehydratase
MFLRTLAMHQDFPTNTIRATNVYGAGQQLWKIIPRSVVYLRLGRKVQLHGGGLAVKSYIHIRDVSRGELAVIQSGRRGAIYHLSPERGCRVRDIVKEVCRAMGRDFDASVEDVGDRKGQDATYIISSERAKTQLGWRPTVTLSDGIREVIEWVDAHWDEIAPEPLEYEHAP